MVFRRTYKYRLYPSKNQQQTIDTQLELCRKLYNEILSVKKETFEQGHQSLSRIDLNKCILYYNARIPELKQVHSQVKQDISDRIDKAFKNMYARIRRGEQKVGYPRFKGRGRYKSICYPQSGFMLTPKKKLKISKIGDINIKLHRPIKGDIKTMTISKTKTNKYYVSFSCYSEDDLNPSKPIIKKNQSVGIDVGLKHFMTLSDGTHIDNPKYFRKSEDKLASVQRQHSKKKLRSNNRQKSRVKVALCHEKIKHQRTDFLHKLSYTIANNYSVIGIENLNIKGMVKNRRLSKSISDVGWGTFYNQLYYKAEYASGIVQESERFYPSTKTCNKCGNIQDMPLHIRNYVCEKCGNIEDRDTNASINLEHNALKILNIVNTVGMTGINACGDVGITHAQEPTSMNQEAPSLN